MRLADVRDLRSLRHEHSTLKQLVADLTLDRHILQEIVRKPRLRSEPAAPPNDRRLALGTTLGRIPGPRVELPAVGDADHLALLAKGANAWNVGRPSKPNLRGARLAQADLSGYDLHDADFSGATLESAVLSRCHAVRTSFANADLTAARLPMASLEGAIFANASIGTAHFGGANLGRADFSRANGIGPVFYGLPLIRCVFCRCSFACRIF
jgi:hypothetical protein